MKKQNQQRLKQHKGAVEEPQQPRFRKKQAKRSSHQIHNPNNVRFFQSHPFSQAQRQQFGFSRLHHRQYGDYLQPEPKDTSICYRRRPGSSQLITTQSIVLLQQRLKNICENYEALINEEKTKNAERSEIIMDLILEMQTQHVEKMELMRKNIAENQEEKKDVGYVDEKMNEIKGNIQQLISQSNTLKQQNQDLERRIAEKRRLNEHKESELEDLNQEVLQVRTEIEEFQLANLKNTKINKQIIQIFNSASTLSSN